MGDSSVSIFVGCQADQRMVQRIGQRDVFIPHACRSACRICTCFCALARLPPRHQLAKSDTQNKPCPPPQTETSPGGRETAVKKFPTQESDSKKLHELQIKPTVQKCTVSPTHTTSSYQTFFFQSPLAFCDTFHQFRCTTNFSQPAFQKKKSRHSYR